MSLLITIMAGILFAAGVYCLLRRNMTKIIIGIILLSQAANLLVFTMGGIIAHEPVFADGKTGEVAAGHADPVATGTCSNCYCDRIRSDGFLRSLF